MMVKLTNAEALQHVTIHVSSSLQQSVEADAVIAIATKAEWLNGTMNVPGSAICKQSIETGVIKAQAGSVHVFPAGEGNVRFLIAIVRSEHGWTTEELRCAFAKAAREAIRLKAAHPAIFVSHEFAVITPEKRTAAVAQAVVEGSLLGAYQRETYKKEAEALHHLQSIELFGAVLDHEQWKAGAERGHAYAIGTTIARDLTNLPGNELYPSTLADIAARIADTYKLEIEVLDEIQLEAKGMGGIIGVGKASVNPPRLIVLKYQGKEEWTDVLGLVGKGITFDTGGISLKRADGMEEMICDMGGSATVLGTMATIGRLRPKKNVICVIASAENMPGGNALKPGDIVKTYSGRTIEVINTDAEGRVVLSDAMTYAKELGASKLIDVATLTGAAIVAFGDVTTAAVTNDEPLLNEVLAASMRAGEHVWALPSHKEYWDLLKSDVADVRNSCGRGGGTITGGLFIGTFADGLPWVHLDIAGTAYLKKSRGVNPKGATGVMVRTLAETIYPYV
ncbi:leucyl aminopeptidase [Paenibacillus agilis]|nr:leucyl aminopeptidase [Paenibacillus agilis]